MDNGAKHITVILMVLSLICGIFLLYLGVSDTIKLNKASKNFKSTQGYLFDYSLHSKGEYDATKNKTTSDTYKLIYNYTVDGKEYKISTNYGTSFVPKIGSKREIKYDANTPSNAIIVGPNNNTGLILGGVIFAGVPLVFLLIFMISLGSFKSTSVDIIGVVIGFIFTTSGCIAIYIITSQNSIKGILNFFYSSFTLPLLIPPIVIATGIFTFIKSLFFNKNSTKN